MTESMFLNLSADVQLHYVISSNRSTKTPLIVFLHYWGGSSSTWNKVESLLGSEYNSLAIDSRGWGQSKGPVDGATAKDYSVSASAKDVVQVLTHISSTGLVDKGIILVGHSMGAKVAYAALSQLPDQLLRAIKGLVLVAPAPPGPLILPEEVSNQQQRAYSSKESVEWTIENVLGNTKNLTEADIALITKDSLAGTHLAVAGWFKEGMPEDITPLLVQLSENLRKPLKVQVLAGDQDLVEPSDRIEKQVIQVLTKHGFATELTVLPHVRHLIPLEAPEAIVTAIRKLV